MGCQCSQAITTTPQQPYPLDPQPLPQPLQSHALHPTPQISLQHTPEPASSLTPTPLLTPVHDKENQPRQSTQKSNKPFGEKGEKKPVSESKIKQKSEKRKSEVPIFDSTNISKINDANKQKSIKDEKPATSRSQYKIDDEISMGPSSKSIDIVENDTKEQPQQQAKEQPLQPKQQPHQQVEQEPKEQPQQQAKEKHKEQPKEQQKEQHKQELKEESKQISDFVLQHWQKGKEEELSSTDRLRREDQKRIESEEVCRYLNEVWDYEKEVLNSIISNLELQETKKYQQPQLLLS